MLSSATVGPPLPGRYSLQAIVKPTDPSIEGLVVSGALQTGRFLDGRKGDPRTTVTSWKGWTGRAYPRRWRPPWETWSAPSLSLPGRLQWPPSLPLLGKWGAAPQEPLPQEPPPPQAVPVER